MPNDESPVILHTLVSDFDILRGGWKIVWTVADQIAAFGGIRILRDRIMPARPVDRHHIQPKKKEKEKELTGRLLLRASPVGIHHNPSMHATNLCALNE